MLEEEQFPTKNANVCAEALKIQAYRMLSKNFLSPSKAFFYKPS
jgi:hypothetical protein